MALLPQDRQSQYMLLITLVMVILGYLFWTYWETPTAAQIASLPRIIVPQDVLLKPAQQQAQKILSDTIGSLLEAQFLIRTFVKSAATPPAPKKATSARPAGNATDER